MRLETPVCARFGLRFPIFGFSHHRRVVAAVSRAGGMGVYGAAYFSPEQVDEDLAWIAANVDGRPFGVDVMFPSKEQTSTASDLDAMQAEMETRVPALYRTFVDSLLERFGVPVLPEGTEPVAVFPLGPSAAAARLHIDSASSHGASLIVCALGTPPADVVSALHDRGLPVGAMVGSPRHAAAQVDAGVDIVIAQGSEAAAHAGDISTMVLVPEIVDLVAPIPVLAAGGIATGRQFLAARALGAQGVWTGSMWRVAAESDEHAGVVERLLTAGSTDTVRSRCMTGKPLRQVRNAWNEAWAADGAPDPLPMPLQRILVTDAEQRIVYHGRADLEVSPIGQVVGQLRAVKPAAALLAELVDDYREALTALAADKVNDK